jgi:hypothetical protein
MQQLMDAESQYIKHWPEGVTSLKISLEKRLQNVAAWPVGPGGALREYFPDNCDFYVAHNWGNHRMLRRAEKLKGEKDTAYWRHLMEIINMAGLSPDRSFIGNALPGIKSGPAAGSMSKDSAYLEDSRNCFLAQLQIIKPRRIIILGDASEGLLKKFLKSIDHNIDEIKIMHPSTRSINWNGTREVWAKRQANKIMLQ